MTIEGVTAAGRTDFREIPDFLHSKLSITALGRQILDETADRIAVQGIDMWYGGLHLEGHTVPWRWDRSSRIPVRC
ncbi:hypothetical protein D3C73_1557650 [compost metagenome]